MVLTANSAEFKNYRNLVNSEGKACRGKYYEANVYNLGKENPKKWWSEVKRICNFKTNEGLSNLMNVEEFSNFSLEDQVNKINAAFLDPLNEYRIYNLRYPSFHWKNHLFFQMYRNLWCIKLYQNLKSIEQLAQITYLTGV
jgi:hypothetical protein